MDYKSYYARREKLEKRFINRLILELIQSNDGSLEIKELEEKLKEVIKKMFENSTNFRINILYFIAFSNPSKLSARTSQDLITMSLAGIFP